MPTPTRLPADSCTAPHRPSVGAKLLPRVEALDGVDLQEDGQRQDGADAGRGLQHGQLGRVVLLSGVLDVGFQASDGRIEGSSRARWVSTRRRTKGSAMSAATFGRLALVFDVAGDGRQVGLAAGGVDVAVQLGALADQAQAGAEAGRGVLVVPWGRRRRAGSCRP